MTTIYNPTPFYVEAAFNGDHFKFEPDEEKNFYNLEVTRSVAQNFGYKGLVHLYYNDEMKKKYKTFEEFKFAQKLNGLNACRKFYKECLLNEKQAERDIKATNGGEVDRDSLNFKKFESALEQIDAEIDKIKQSLTKKPQVKEQINEAKVLQNDERPAQKRFGRSKKAELNEQRDDQDKGQAQA